MSDPTSLINLGNNAFQTDVHRYEGIIKDSEALVINGLAAAAANTGEIEFADDADHLIPCGLVIQPSDGNNDHLTGSSTYKWKAVCRGGIIVRWAVTGAASVADNGKLVYATDGQTLTLTQPATGLPSGFVVHWISSTTCDVYLFSYSESIKMQSSGQGTKAIKVFGTFPTNAIQGTNAATLWTETALDHYSITSLHAQCVAFDNAVIAGSQTLNIDIGGTNTTGGVLTLAYTNCDAYGDMGTAIDATAITAANEVHQGDVVKLELAGSGTGFTADAAAAFLIYAIIQKLPGA